ncbi:MAG: hypothetical protein COB51_13345 [Moraxellaceae bacterium]|nr:MAG: hypothetical protein COB51_13345 [Moraxellaceae bacterium]
MSSFGTRSSIKVVAMFGMLALANSNAIAENKTLIPLEVYCLVESENMKDQAPDEFSSELVTLRGYSEGAFGKRVLLKTERYEFSVSPHVVVGLADTVKIFAFKNSIMDLDTGTVVSGYSATGIGNRDPRRATLTLVTHERNRGRLVPQARLEFDCFERR